MLTTSGIVLVARLATATWRFFNFMFQEFGEKLLILAASNSAILFSCLCWKDLGVRSIDARYLALVG